MLLKPFIHAVGLVSEDVGKTLRAVLGCAGWTLLTWLTGLSNSLVFTCVGVSGVLRTPKAEVSAFPLDDPEGPLVSCSLTRGRRGWDVCASPWPSCLSLTLSVRGIVCSWSSGVHFSAMHNINYFQKNAGSNSYLYDMNCIHRHVHIQRGL